MKFGTPNKRVKTTTPSLLHMVRLRAHTLSSSTLWVFGFCCLAFPTPFSTFQFNWCSDRCAWETPNYSLEHCLGTFRFQTSVFQHLTHFVEKYNNFGFQAASRQPPAGGRQTADQSRPRVDEKPMGICEPVFKAKILHAKFQEEPQPTSQQADGEIRDKAPKPGPRPDAGAASRGSRAATNRGATRNFTSLFCLLLELPSLKPQDVQMLIVGITKLQASWKFPLPLTHCVFQLVHWCFMW